jgi:hypothetical protein
MGYILGDFFTNSSGHPGARTRKEVELPVLLFKQATPAE